MSSATLHGGHSFSRPYMSLKPRVPVLGLLDLLVVTT
jgi:hypothetical protein